MGRDPEGDGDESMDEDNGSIVRSPSRLRYNIERLSSHTQKLVRSLWGQSFEEPPEISLQWCDRMLDSDGKVDFYAFQMHEVVPRSVRIGSPKSQYSEPQCQCGASKPCKHLIWLSDYIARQVLYSNDPEEPLTLNERGYPNELGEPFRCISDMHLDVLADSLHCEVGHPLARADPSPQRVAGAQSIIASIADADEHVFDSYRSDLTSPNFDSRLLVHHKDPEATLFSLLLASHRLSAWLRSRLRPSDPPRNPFRQIESRARRIFSDFDIFLSSSSAAESSPDAEGPCDILWAATSLTRCVRQIHALVARAEEPLSPVERSSAARALVRVLRGVVERHKEYKTGKPDHINSLYNQLIADRDEGFVTDTLELLVDQSQFVDELEDIMATVGVRGAAASWVAKMEAVVVRMRTSRRSSAASRSGRRAGKERERLLSPALGPVGHGEPGSASASGVGIGGDRGAGLGISYDTGAGAGSSASVSASTTGSGVHFVAPESTVGTPTRGGGSSASRGASGGGRGGQGSASGAGGAGSKRSGAETKSERGSKRAR